MSSEPGGASSRFEPGAPGSARLLRRNRTFLRFWIGRVASHLGDGAAAAAVVLFAQRTRGTGTAVGAVLLAAGLPKVLGPVAGALADRVDQRRLMIACDLTQAVLFAALAAWVPPFAVLVAAVAVASTVDTAFAPAGFLRTLPPLPPLPASGAGLWRNAWTGIRDGLRTAWSGRSWSRCSSASPWRRWTTWRWCSWPAISAWAPWAMG